jgi:hypothetical protein
MFVGALLVIMDYITPLFKVDQDIQRYSYSLIQQKRCIFLVKIKNCQTIFGLRI